MSSRANRRGQDRSADLPSSSLRAALPSGRVIRFPLPTPTVPNCLFCSIVDGTIPGDVVLETEDVLAFRDIAPQAPTHVLVIPKRHVSSLAETTPDDTGLLGALLAAAVAVARQEGVEEDGFRTVINTGDEGGQTVHHIHVHVLGGRALSWPPG